jgi:hypothetical protein
MDEICTITVQVKPLMKDIIYLFISVQYMFNHYYFIKEIENTLPCHILNQNIWKVYIRTFESVRSEL